MAALDIHMGATARATLEREGWRPELFSTVLGASGGPKWFILAALDRVLFGDFFANRQAPLHLIGSSIGSWRHACAAQADPVAAIDRMQQAYLHQSYATEKPTVAEISAVSHQILDQALGPNGGAAVVNHPSFRTHIVTARGRGLTNRAEGAALIAGLALSALGNAVHRQLLTPAFQRVVFSSHGPFSATGVFDDFGTHTVALRPESVAPALRASGAIPFVLSPERDITGGPSGHYWDGGILDYHFDLPEQVGEGLVLYPHFTGDITPGWFDKFLPWRRGRPPRTDNLVLLSPSKAFLASLPHGKIPDRDDFRRLSPDARVQYWQHCIEAGEALAEDFRALMTR